MKKLNYPADQKFYAIYQNGYSIIGTGTSENDALSCAIKHAAPGDSIVLDDSYRVDGHIYCAEISEKLFAASETERFDPEHYIECDGVLLLPEEIDAEE